MANRRKSRTGLEAHAETGTNRYTHAGSDTDSQHLRKNETSHIRTHELTNTNSIVSTGESFAQMRRFLILMGAVPQRERAGPTFHAGLTLRISIPPICLSCSQTFIISLSVSFCNLFLSLFRYLYLFQTKPSLPIRGRVHTFSMHVYLIYPRGISVSVENPRMPYIRDAPFLQLVMAPQVTLA